MRVSHLYLHIGTPKTGTTSVQTFCQKNRKLLKQHDFSYYTDPVRHYSACKVIKALNAGLDMSQYIQRFQSWCQGADTDNLLFSSESLFRTHHARLTKFLGPERWDSITVICYLRPQDELFEGIYKQFVKWGKDFTVSDVLAPAFQSYGSYDTGLSAWQDWVSEQKNARLIVRRYGDATAQNGNIGVDFFEQLGLQGQDFSTPPLNVSPSGLLVDLYAKLPEIERFQQINRKMVASDLPGICGHNDVFDDDLRQQIRQKYQKVNERVRARFFPQDDALFTPPEPMGKPQGDVTEIRELLLQIISDLRGEEIAAQARAALAGPG